MARLVLSSRYRWPAFYSVPKIHTSQGPSTSQMIRTVQATRNWKGSGACYEILLSFASLVIADYWSRPSALTSMFSTGIAAMNLPRQVLCACHGGDDYQVVGNIPCNPWLCPKQYPWPWKAGCLETWYPRIESGNRTCFQNNSIVNQGQGTWHSLCVSHPLSPTTSGKIEQYSEPLKTILRVISAGTWKHWDSNLAEATWLVNTSGSANWPVPSQAKALHTVGGSKVTLVDVRELPGKDSEGCSSLGNR